MTPGVSFITGASSGIGRALALELAERGARLALAARRVERLRELENRLGKSDNLLVMPCDVTRQEDVRKAIATTLERFGGIDLALLSAGVSGRTKPLKFAAAPLEKIVSTNLFGVAYCLEELIPLMARSGKGTIAVLSSLAADRSLTDSAPYSASKAAVSMLFDGMRATLASRGVRLITIEPGFVRTEMTEGFERMPFLMEADESARLILRRIERGDKVIRFPLVPSLFMKLVRMTPNFVFDALSSKLSRKV
jgi:NAD(P)-dependent dehydrogenase (short-subunit alcohol dehydrogenase family)